MLNCGARRLILTFAIAIRLFTVALTHVAMWEGPIDFRPFDGP
jgi:hypothetical protein